MTWRPTPWHANSVTQVSAYHAPSRVLTLADPYHIAGLIKEHPEGVRAECFDLYYHFLVEFSQP